MVAGSAYIKKRKYLFHVSLNLMSGRTFWEPRRSYRIRMKPIGTVTKYYPLLTQETVEIVEALVNTAKNYRNFVKNLADSIEDIEMSEELAQFAVVQGSILGWGRDDEVWDKIVPRCDEHFSVKPWFRFNNPKFERVVTEDAFAKSIDDVIHTNLNDWYVYHILIMGSWIGRWKDHFRWLGIASDLVEKNSKLVCLTPHRHHLEAHVKRREGDYEGSIINLETAMKIAEEYDDIHSIAVSKNMLGEYQMDFNPHEALSVLDESFKIFEELGDLTSAGFTANNMGELHRITGEYDLSLRFYHWIFDVSIKHVMDRGFGLDRIVRSMVCVYNDLGEPEQTLEWLLGIEKDGMQNRYCELERARTQILQGNLKDGLRSLENVYAKIMKTGIDLDIAQYNFVLGLHELKNNKLDTALFSLSQALQEFERLNYQSLINQCLIALARLEIEETVKSNEPKDSASSGPWMTKLGDHAKERDYPGIRMQYSLLKAEYQSQIGDEEAAILTLRDALAYSDSPGVKTLKERILEELSILESV